MTEIKPDRLRSRLAWRIFPLFLIFVALIALFIIGSREIFNNSLKNEAIGDFAELRVPQPLIGLLREDQTAIYYGIHVENIYNLSLQSRTFSADGYIWLEWSSKTQRLMEEKNIALYQLFRFENLINKWQYKLDPATVAPTKLSAGRYYQRYHFSGSFYDDEIDYLRDPFDKLILPIVVELEPDSMSNKYEQTFLYPHHQQNGFVGIAGEISGYVLEDASLKSYIKRYPSRFGSWFKPERSQARLEITYNSDYWSMFVTWILPLMIVMSVVLMAPSLAVQLGSVRLAIPSSALLTLVFLHHTYHVELPPLPYLTFLDQLFACSYIISVGLFALFTWGANVYSTTNRGEREAVIKRIKKTDMLFQVGSVSLYLVVTAFAWGDALF
jgi:hypothetical protein